MAVGKFDLAAASDILKEQYDPNDAYKILTQESPLVGLMKREKGVLVGSKYRFGIQYGTGRGVATTLAKARTGRSTNLYTDLELTRGRLYGSGGIDRETMKVAQEQKASFARSLSNEQDGLMDTMAERLVAWSYGNGGGSCGKIAAIAGSTITLSDISDAANFQENGQYEIAGNDGTSGALRAAAQLTCVSVDRDTGIVTFSAGVVATIAGTIVGDYVFPAGDHATVYADTYGKRVIVGLDGWVPMTAPTATPFFGMDRSKDPVRLGGCRYQGRGAPIEEQLQLASAKFHQQGANKIDTIIMNSSRVQELLVGLGNRVQFTELVNKETKVGFSGIKIATPQGSMTVLGDRACKTDRAYALQLDTWALLTNGEFPEFIEDDGLTIRRATDGTDGYEWEMAGYAQIACRKPGKNGVIDLGLG